MVLFAVHGLLKDPPFSRVDLISCRNLLIYLDRDLQEQVCSTFHYALNPGGYPAARRVRDAPKIRPACSARVDRNARIYQSTARPGDKPRLLPRLLGPGAACASRSPSSRAGESASSRSNEAAAHRAAHRDSSRRRASWSTRRIGSMHMSDNAGRYLQPSGGPLTRRCRRSGAAGAALRTALGAAPRFRAAAIDGSACRSRCASTARRIACSCRCKPVDAGRAAERRTARRDVHRGRGRSTKAGSIPSRRPRERNRTAG